MVLAWRCTKEGSIRIENTNPKITVSRHNLKQQLGFRTFYTKAYLFIIASSVSWLVETYLFQKDDCLSLCDVQLLGTVGAA